MRDPHPLRAIIILPRQIKQQVSRPPQNLMHKGIPQARNGRILRQLRKLDQTRIRLVPKIALQP
jgi:hypothetical protein